MFSILVLWTFVIVYQASTIVCVLVSIIVSVDVGNHFFYYNFISIRQYIKLNIFLLFYISSPEILSFLSKDEVIAGQDESYHLPWTSNTPSPGPCTPWIQYLERKLGQRWYPYHLQMADTHTPWRRSEYQETRLWLEHHGNDHTGSILEVRKHVYLQNMKVTV